MSKQRQILVTITYNDLGCIIDTKAEPYEEPNLQPTCNQFATDCINRSAALDVIRNIRAIAGSYDSEILLIDKAEAQTELMMLPSAQPSVSDCWGCNCPKMERSKEQKTFSEMVHLHDDETHEEHTETHARDWVERQAAIDAVDVKCLHRGIVKALQEIIEDLPSVQPEQACDECVFKPFKQFHPERKKGGSGYGTMK